MARDSGFGLDFLTQVVNVQWGGLAVEFGKEAEDAPEPPGATTTSTKNE